MLNHSAPDKSSLLSGVHVAGSVASPATLARLSGMDLPALCDIVEFRVDTWPDHAAEGLECAAACPVPALITVRCPAEGGQNNLPLEERLRLARLFLPAAQLLDIEIASLTDMAPLVAEARAHGIPIVASAHDFTGTPSPDELRRRRDTALAAGADIVKFAAHLDNTRDLATLAELLEEPGHPPLSLMGMGPLGRVSRLLFARLGSILNYGYLDAATVPGQWPAPRLRTLIREL